MESDARLGHNDANVIFERFGDEVVAIHLGTGCYYSLPGVAGDAFLLLPGTSTVSELAEALSSKYEAPAHLIADDLPRFVQQLRDEALIVEVKHANGGGVDVSGMFSDPRLPYTAPAVYSHRDLENLFLVDPVHDAGEEGWPHVRRQPETGNPGRYRFASERCLIERFDEATVAVNLSTGAYFSVSGPAEDILLLLHNAPTKAEIVKALSTKYIAADAQLLEAVDAFLTRLSEVDLIVTEQLEGDPECRALTLAKPGKNLVFEAPEIDIFRDAPALVVEGAEKEKETTLLSGRRKFRLNRDENILAFVSDGAVAVNLVRGHYFILNSTAARVLRMLEKEPVPSEIVDALERDYQARRPELVAAVIVLLKNFLGIGLAAAEAAGEQAATPPNLETAGQRVPFEPFSVDLRQDLRDQICVYPAGQPVAPEPASRSRFLSAVLEENFEEASSRAAVCETRLLLAGRRLLIRCVGETQSRDLSLALAHLRQEFAEEPDLTIHVWSGHAASPSSNALLSSYLQILYRDWTTCCGSRGELRGFHSPAVPVFYVPGPDVLNLVDVANRKAFFFKRDASPLPYWEAGSPFRHILHAWLSAEGVQFVHGGAVGDGSGGVLLAGRGGSGKSTTTLLCLNAGMLYAGDDYCAVSCGSPLYVHSLYNTAKLLPRDLDRFPELRTRIWNPQALAENSLDKAVFFLADVLRERISLGFPLRAVLMPRVTPQTDTSLTPCGPGAALAALAPTTVAQLQNTGQPDMDRIAAIVSQVPAYILNLGSDLTQVADVVRSALR